MLARWPLKQEGAAWPLTLRASWGLNAEHSNPSDGKGRRAWPCCKGCQHKATPQADQRPRIGTFQPGEKVSGSQETEGAAWPLTLKFRQIHPGQNASGRISIFSLAKASGNDETEGAAWPLTLPPAWQSLRQPTKRKERPGHLPFTFQADSPWQEKPGKRAQAIPEPMQ